MASVHSTREAGSTSIAASYSTCQVCTNRCGASQASIMPSSAGLPSPIDVRYGWPVTGGASNAVPWK